MKKHVSVLLAVFSILLLASPAAALVTAPEKSSGTPFDKVWAALLDLQGQVLAIQSVPGPKGDTGAVGPQGPPGPAGTCEISPAAFSALEARVAALEGWCGGADLQTDERNCGTCMHACAEGEMCVAGSCAQPAECSGTQTRSCGTSVGVCRSQQTCSNGVWGECVQTVPPSTEACDTRDNDCDGETDEGSLCPSYPNSYSACVSGVCRVASCTAGFGDCDGNAANGCESNIVSSTSSCGRCGSVCPIGSSCSAGMCVYPTSCAAIKAANPSAPSGVYWVNSGTGAQQVCCDMVTSGGGRQCSTSYAPSCACPA